MVAPVMSVCVAGAGTIGSLLAGHLGRVTDVSVLVRREEHAVAQPHGALEELLLLQRVGLAGGRDGHHVAVELLVELPHAVPVRLRRRLRVHLLRLLDSRPRLPIQRHHLGRLAGQELLGLSQGGQHEGAGVGGIPARVNSSLDTG